MLKAIKYNTINPFFNTVDHNHSMRSLYIEPATTRRTNSIRAEAMI